MKQELRLYNVIFPIWMLWLAPQAWLIALPGNLIVDVVVLTVTLKVLGHRNKLAVVKELWWKFWLFGFLADFVGVAAAVALAGYCIYRFDRRAMKDCPLLSETEKHRIALTMAVVTAPWMFFIPVY